MGASDVRDNFEDYLGRQVRSPVLDRAATRDTPVAMKVCAVCNRPYELAEGEVRFAREAGLPTWDNRCKRHRPTRRQLVALGAKP